MVDQPVYLPVPCAKPLDEYLRFLARSNNSSRVATWRSDDDAIEYLKASCCDTEKFRIVALTLNERIGYENHMRIGFYIARPPPAVPRLQVWWLLLIVGLYLAFSFTKGFWLSTDRIGEFFLTELIGFIAIPICAFVLVSRSEGLANRWKFFTSSPLLGQGGVLMVSFYAAAFFTMAYWVPYIVSVNVLPESLRSDPVNYALAVPQAGVTRLLAATYFVLSAAIVEEFFFRGCMRILFIELFRRFVDGTFIVSSALLFGLAHWSHGLAVVISTTSLGLVAAWFFCWQRDIRPLVFGHAFVGALPYLMTS